MQPHTPDRPLCSSCGLHPAHTFLTEIINGVMTNSSFCDECANLRHLTTDADGISIYDAKCAYCGGKAAGGSSNHQWEMYARKQTMHYTCMRCMRLYQQFLIEALGSIQELLSPEDRLRRMETLVGEVDARVRSEVSE